MGAIEDVYEDLDADVSLEEFEEAVHEKVEQMGGLADEETAAMLIAHEVADEEVSTVADIKPGMEEVKFLGKVVGIGEKRTFERDGDQADGRVVNVELADESGSVRVAFWDEMADSAVEELEPGTVLRVAGRPKEGYNGVEVNADRAEPEPDAEIDVQVTDTYRIEDLRLGLSDVTLRGRVLDADADARTFSRDDGSEGQVANVVLGDPTGRVRLTLWDGMAERAAELEVGRTVEVVDGYVRERDDDLELHVGERGDVAEVDEEIEYVPDTADIADLEIGQTADITGGVIETEEKRTFERDDGTQGQVRNVRVRDDTGDIRVALWGEKADADIELADRVLVTDAEIQDGWQDELEASAGWQSTVSLLGDDAGGSTRSDGDESAGGAGGAAGLSAFTVDDGTDDGTTAGAGQSEEADDGGNDGVVEFTGTVVQSGDPIVLDDGTETRSVETEESVTLGQELTVRGREREGHIDAEDVF